MAKDKRKRKRAHRLPWWFYAGWTIAIGGVVGGLWYYLGLEHVNSFVKSNDANPYGNAGTYGDSFGYVNSLFSGLAFGGVIFAIILQTIELRYQREELTGTRKDVKRSAEAQEKMVELNALTVLVQTYVEQYKGNQHHYNEEYVSMIRSHPETLTRSLKFKLNNCSHLLEKIFSEASGTPMGDILPMDAPSIRRRHWLGHLLWTSDHQEAMVRNFRTPSTEDDGRASMASVLNAQIGRMTDLLGYCDAVEPTPGAIAAGVERVQADMSALRDDLNSRATLQPEDMERFEAIAQRMRELQRGAESGG